CLCAPPPRSSTFPLGVTTSSLHFPTAANQDLTTLGSLTHHRLPTDSQGRLHSNITSAIQCSLHRMIRLYAYTHTLRPASTRPALHSLRSACQSQSLRTRPNPLPAKSSISRHETLLYLFLASVLRTHVPYPPAV